jgi:nucleotide-binding universal stress UspA family protein
MTDKMKILIAYDGSDCADAALADLKRAGLPSDAEAIVLAVDEQWLPTPTSYGMVETVHETAHPVSESVDAMAKRAAGCLQELFPSWQVSSEAHGGSPASLILTAAGQRQTDLIVVGSHGRTGILEWLLGSVSQKVIYHAPCSVRIARGRDVPADAPIRFIVGVDGSESAEAAAREAARRDWPDGTQVLLLSVLPQIPALTSGRVMAPIAQWIKEERARVVSVAERLEAELREVGCKVSVIVRDGDPRGALLEEAKHFDADCIFVGATGMSAIDRFLLGSVSGGVAARASCSVEIVRTKTEQ